MSFAVPFHFSDNSFVCSVSWLEFWLVLHNYTGIDLTDCLSNWKCADWVTVLWHLCCGLSHSQSTKMTEPSKVLHIRNVGPEVTEVRCCQKQVSFINGFNDFPFTPLFLCYQWNLPLIWPCFASELTNLRCLFIIVAAWPSPACSGFWGSTESGDAPSQKSGVSHKVFFRKDACWDHKSEDLAMMLEQKYGVGS